MESHRGEEKEEGSPCFSVEERQKEDRGRKNFSLKGGGGVYLIH